MSAHPPRGNRFAFVCGLAGLVAGALCAADFDDRTADLNALPTVTPGFELKLFAREPLVRNPCSMAFDTQGRLCVGMGPQYRNPTPDTPGDSVVLVLDTDGDGVADATKVFATGFNAIQALAWRGRDLWVANSPDLTIVRDLDGDDEADEYVLVYTDLGNLEHALHGLNWAPDGKLYMSKGNSKGVNRPDRYAPKAFRDLWGVSAPPGAKDLPEPRTFKKGEYKHTYQDPEDDWGRSGGVLRCDDGGRNLEIVARGFRNPWDITFDDGFNWLGTDNDQSDGDRIFMPFAGADFGWSHAWSSSWSGEGHLPTVPISGPVFNGSGTGIIYYDAPQFPEPYRGVFFVNDWLLKKTRVYRPRWDGALRQPEGGRYEDFIVGANALFRPTDIEVGPDCALYCLGWGREYGVQWDANRQMANEGRVFRIAWKAASPLAWRIPKRAQPLAQWSVPKLIEELGAHLPVWRVNAQDELIRRGRTVKQPLLAALTGGQLNQRQETWAAWTLGRLAPGVEDITADFQILLAQPSVSLNLRIQSVRILAHQSQQSGNASPLPAVVTELLKHSEPRLRFEAVQAIGQMKPPQVIEPLQALVAGETDRLTFYSGWKALRHLVTPGELKGMLADPRGGVRRAALLALTDLDAVTEAEVKPLLDDHDGKTAALAGLWLSARHGNPVILFEPPAGQYATEVRLQLNPTLKPSEIRYTLNGSEPTLASPRAGNIRIQQTTTVKARLFMRKEPVGRVAEAVYQIGVVTNPAVSLLKPLAAPTTLAQALTALPTGNTRRGEELFFDRGGAGCFNCHRVGSRGNNFGPELTGLGARAEARHVAQSMLEPNAVITEGFNAHAVETADAEYSGMLLEETGVVLALALGNGQRVSIEKRNIKQHTTLKTSAMPSFAEVLSPQQVADITAFLLAQKNTSTGTIPAAGTATTAGFAFEQNEDRLRITHSGQPVADFVFRDDKILRPYFANISVLGGGKVTRNHPPIAGLDATDHDTMHPGLWLAFGDISGADFWRNKGRIEHVRFTELPAVNNDRLSFATECRLRTADGQSVCSLTNRITLAARTAGWLLVWDATFRSDDGEFTFGDQEEMGFGARVATALTEKNGGEILNAHGVKTAKATWGQSAAWCDYSGVVDGRRLGIMLMPDPANFRPSWWHNRDYGVFVANPFGREAMKQGGKSAVTVKRGEPFRLRFGAWLHSAPAGAIADLPAAYRDFLGFLEGS